MTSSLVLITARSTSIIASVEPHETVISRSGSMSMPKNFFVL
jgi:hypothetical protein